MWVAWVLQAVGVAHTVMSRFRQQELRAAKLRVEMVATNILGWNAPCQVKFIASAAMASAELLEMLLIAGDKAIPWCIRTNTALVHMRLVVISSVITL